ncbi:MAG: CBS domain-containing protein [Vicinamibacteria bacterium]
MFRVKDIMTDEVIACRPDDSLESAVQVMKDRGCGCVPVVDAKMRVVGLVTDRDAVLCALRKRKPLFELRVRDASTHGVISCQVEDTLERAEVLMRVNHVRRLPVVGPDRVLVGVMSLTDLARHLEVSEGEGCNGLSPRHIAILLAETSGVRQPVAATEHKRTREKGPHPIIEPIFHG